MSIFNRHYRHGRKTAKRYVKILDVDTSITKDPSAFLDRVYTEAVSPLAKPLETGVNFATTNIANFEREIDTYSKEKDELIAKLTISDEQHEVTEEDSMAVSQKLRERIEEIGEKIDALKAQLAEAQTEYARESAKEKPQHQGSKLSVHIKALYSKINAASKELSPLSFYLILVLVDYFVAVSFFKDFAAGRGFPTEQVVGYVVPLIITLSSMMLMQMMFEGIRKIRTNGGNNTFSIFSAVLPGFMLLALFIFMFFIRVIKDSDNIVIETLIWLLFIVLVFVVGSKLDKEGKDAKMLLALPTIIVVNLLGIAGAVIAWPFENIALIFSREKYTLPQTQMRSVMENLKARIAELSAEKREKEMHITNLPKLLAEGKMSKIEFDRKQREALIQPEIRKRDSLINRARINLTKHKESQKTHNDHLVKLRMGSDSGAMGQLYRELKRIKKAQRRNLAKISVE